MRAIPSRLVLLGHPVAHSLSPLFQNAALRSAGIPVVYSAVDVDADSLPGTVRTLVAEGAGGNVTIPHKERFADLCAECTETARRVGAVNTFWVDDGRLVGDNTDVGGFESAVVTLLGRRPTDLRIALLGAGGVALAVLAAASQWPGSRVLCYNRARHRAVALARRWPDIVRAATTTRELLADVDLVVNATPVGATDDAHPVAVHDIPARAAVLDLAYRPGGTSWVRAARALGLSAMDGLHMLVEQGALAFERWFHRPAPRAEMFRAAASAMQT